MLVACFGNVLRGDDGVGAAVAVRLLAAPLPPGVRVMEVGIGGIHLVQELLHEQVDLLVVVDAVDLGHAPGSVLVQRPELLEVTDVSDDRSRDRLADMHLATPERALQLAHDLGVLPADVLVVGVQSTDTERVGEGLSVVTAAAVDTAVAEVLRLTGACPPKDP